MSRARLAAAAMAPILLVACVATPIPVSTPSPAPSLSPAAKVLVAADGLYRVTGAELQAAGADVSAMDPATLQLFLGDREVAMGVSGRGPGLELEFYGQATDSPYTAFSAYLLRWGQAQGKRFDQVPQVSVAAGPPDQPYTGTLRLTQPRLFVPQAGGEGAPWFWLSLVAPVTATIPVTLPAALAAPALLTLRLWGNSQDPATPDHRATVRFNDVQVADESWDGIGERVLRVAIPAGVVRGGENSLRLSLPGGTEARADIVLLQSLEITYLRQLVAQAGRLDFWGGQGVYNLSGFGNGPVGILDITEPLAPGRMADAVAADGSVTFSAADGPQRHWLAVGRGAWRSVQRILPVAAPALRQAGRQADYLVITPPDLVAAVQPLVRWRAEHGLKVAVVTTDQVYDEFGGGAESPTAIKDLLSWAYREWERPAPRFVLLVGKASYDYRDYLGGPNKSLVPTFLLSTPHLGLAASDNWFVAADDGRPTMALGRIPAKTPEQVAGAVAKIIAYEKGSSGADWRRRGIFVADDKEAEFSGMSDRLAARLPAAMTVQKVYLAQRGGDLKAARADLTARWNEGAQLLVYVGHGSLDTWAAGPLFGRDNLPGIRNGERLPVLVTPTCLDGFFYHPLQDSLTEELLFKADGGVVAGFVPTGLSLPAAQEALMSAFFAELFADSAPTLGEAILRAKRAVASDAPEMREVVETFVLLGDPALVVRGSR